MRVTLLRPPLSAAEKEWDETIRKMAEEIHRSRQAGVSESSLRAMQHTLDRLTAIVANLRPLPRVLIDDGPGGRRFQGQ